MRRSDAIPEALKLIRNLNSLSRDVALVYDRNRDFRGGNIWRDEAKDRIHHLGIGGKLRKDDGSVVGAVIDVSGGAAFKSDGKGAGRGCCRIGGYWIIDVSSLDEAL